MWKGFHLRVGENQQMWSSQEGSDDSDSVDLIKTQVKEKLPSSSYYVSN